MRAFSVACIAGLIACEALGQATLPFDARVDLNPGFRNKLALSGLFDYNANTVRNGFPLALLQGGFLERDLRSSVSDRLKEKGNTAGLVLAGRLQWTGAACWSKHPGWRPIVSIAQHEQSGLSFTADQFDLTFFGNSSFQERTAALAPSSYQQIRYQTIGGGVLDQSSGSFVRLDVIRGQSMARADVRWATLFTGADGRALRSALLGDYVASDTAGSAFDRTNGLGGALSAHWGFTPRWNQAVRFSVGVEDLGLIVWNKHSVEVEKDTLIRFVGWQVENLFALDAVLVNEQAVVDTFGLGYRVGRITQLAPFRLSADVSLPLNDRHRLDVLLEHRHLPGYIPQLSVQGSQVTGSRTMLGATLSYGGFGGLRLGFAAKRRFGEHVLVTLSTPQLAGFITTGVSGIGMFVGVSIGL
ncbi:MAG: hypothetical protein JNJ91_02490 [Flavobacteriales bacterium]|nr:hypothetical protein [Flavobacteriales bacterium]